MMGVNIESRMRVSFIDFDIDIDQLYFGDSVFEFGIGSF